jgi:hypothetical protein
MIQMIAKLRRKPVIVGLISLSVVALLAALAVPAMTVSASGTGGNPPNQNIAHVQGTASGSITITPTSGNSLGPLVFNGSYTVIYNSQTSVAERVMLNMPRQTPGTGGNPPNHNFKGVRGTIQGISSDNTTMTISLTNGPGSLAQGQTVIILPSPAAGTAESGVSFGGRFSHHGSGGSSSK